MICEIHITGYRPLSPPPPFSPCLLIVRLAQFVTHRPFDLEYAAHLHRAFLYIPFDPSWGSIKTTAR